MDKELIKAAQNIVVQAFRVSLMGRVPPELVGEVEEAVRKIIQH
jgi:hypothetical protein